MTKRRLFWAGLLLVTLLASAVIEQRGGGKAEPLRIEFKRGASGATLNDTIRGSEEAEYVFTARQSKRTRLRKNTSASVRFPRRRSAKRNALGTYARSFVKLV